MRSLTFYALAYPFLVLAEPIDYAPPPDGKYDLSGVNWNTVSYTNGFGAWGGEKDKQPAPTTPPDSSSAQSSPAQPTGGNGGGDSSSSSSSSSTTSASSPGNTGSSSSSSSSGSSANTGSTKGDCGNEQTVEIKNTSGKDLHVAQGFPWVTSGKYADGSSWDCSVISHGASCTTCQKTGLTGGNLQLGYGNADGCARGTWIEGNSLTTPCVDITYIPGYSVPVKCTSGGPGGSQTVGTMEALCHDENCSNCESGGGTWINNSCQNPAGDSNNPLQNGPSPQFFMSVEKDAYTYPAGDSLSNNPENKVVAFGSSWISMSCEVGSPIKSSSSNKRDVEVEKREPQPKALEDVIEKRAPIVSEPEVQQPSAHRHIGRRHGKRRHAHAHAAVEGSM